MKTRLVTAALVAGLFAMAPQAQAAKSDPTKITCQEFVGLKDSVKPRVVAYLDGYEKGKENLDASSEVDVNRELKAVVDVCVQAPKASLWDKLRSHFPGGKKKVKPVAMTCESFVALDETTRPEVAFWLAGYNRAKGAETEAADQVDLEQDLAYALIDCKPTPKESLWQKIKGKF